MSRFLLSLFVGLGLLGTALPGTAHAARSSDNKFFFFQQPTKPAYKPAYAKPSFYKPARSADKPSIKPGTKKGTVKVEISRDQQRMNVYVAGQLQHTWAVSTGRSGYKTPRGAYKPTWMTKMWHSKQWNNAPMPHSVFFKNGYAIHATNEVGKLGRPASHGCVRLAPQNAAKLFTLIKAHGEKKTVIVVG